MIRDLEERFRVTSERVVPWFMAAMPPAYFQDTDHATRLSHVAAIVAARASGLPPRLILEQDAGNTWTFIHESDHPGLLAELLAQLPRDRALVSAKVHTAADGNLVLDVFRFGEPPVNTAIESADRTNKLQQMQTYLDALGEETRAEMVMEHLAASSDEYVRTVSPLRIHETWKLSRRVLGTDDTAAAFSEQGDSDFQRISVATGNANPRSLFERMVAYLGQRGFDIRRAYLDVFAHSKGASVTVLGFVIDPKGQERLAEGTEHTETLRADLLRLEWVDDRVIALARVHPELGLRRAEVIHALIHLIHPMLAREDGYAFARERLYELAERHLPIVRAIAELFLERFEPSAPLSQTAFNACAHALGERIEREVDGDHDRRLASTMLDGVRASLRTNVFLENRYGLGIRFQPAFLVAPDGSELPYGAFFVHGRGYDGFHVRFRDIARGGVRIVKPRGREQYAVESERLFDEAYELAYAQQLKNKDIPEGGSKGVVLVEPETSVQQGAKGFIDVLLDLITPDPAVRARVVDLFGRPELLYLGPDENISPAMIEWVVDRAARRGHPAPNTFMSSKPGAGINHKEYGVTSEGVTVFLEEALRAVGIDPRRQIFTVKITGGPDGDVAGNELRILHREFGDHARIVGIADGSGSARDPNGLDHVELLRLVEGSLPITSFDRSRLSPIGAVVSVDEPNGLRLRNGMHNEIIADAFIPAGGRPQTIHAGNWQAFSRDGKPSSRVIVEGANLFITPEARTELSRAGVLIVKDSSANKCGVICSSYEIVGSMLLTAEELLQVKERFVAEVLVKLRELARREAVLLFRERARNPTLALPELSVELSRTITRATDAIESVLPSLAVEQRALFDRLVMDHLPGVLIERAKERIATHVPKPYLARIIACALAARIVYREGVAFLGSLPEARLAELAVAYLEQERETEALVAAVRASSMPDRERIAALLALGGTRAALQLS